MASWSTSTTKSSSTTKTQEQGRHESTTKNVLDQELLQTILGGLAGQMTQEEIAAFAENLLKPQLNAGIEAAQQGFETTKLSKEQEIEKLERTMKEAAKMLEFEYAAVLRDQIKKLRQELEKEDTANAGQNHH